MSPDQYQELVEFIAVRFDRQREETDAFRGEIARLGGSLGGVEESLRGEIARVEQSLQGEIARVEVRVESLQDDLRGVADGVLANGQKIELNGVRIDGLVDRLDRMEISSTTK